MKDFHGVMYDWDMQDGVAIDKPAYIFAVHGGKKTLVEEVRP